MVINIKKVNFFLASETVKAHCCYRILPSFIKKKKKRIGSRRKNTLHFDFECVDENPWTGLTIEREPLILLTISKQK